MEQAEISARLASLNDGPWREKGQFARGKLYNPVVDESLSLDQFDLPISPVRLEDESFLRESLRYSGSDPVTNRTSLRLRGSLDSAFTHLQLIELAIRTGYLPVDSVHDFARRDLAHMLSFQPAHRFAVVYQYDPVVHLAGRMEIGGLSGAVAPAVDDGNAIRFAGFLASLYQIEASAFVAEWRRVAENHMATGWQSEYLNFLAGRSESKPRRLAQVLGGVREFIVTLADFFRSLPAAEQPPFALFYRYWLQKLFAEPAPGVSDLPPSWAESLRIWVNALPSNAGTDQWQREEQVLLLECLEILEQAVVAGSSSLRDPRSLDIRQWREEMGLENVGEPTLTRFGGPLDFLTHGRDPGENPPRSAATP
jgi:hypothetical protein